MVRLHRFWRGEPKSERSLLPESPNIHVTEGVVESAGIKRGCGLLLKVVEPGHLLAACAGDEHFGEQLPKRRIALAPHPSRISVVIAYAFGSRCGRRAVASPSRSRRRARGARCARGAGR